MKISSCNNVSDFRELARKNLPSPIFHYIDGAADDEVTCKRNTASYDDCFLVPRVLRSVETVDLGTKILGKKISLPFFLSPTALQRLFHHEGEMAVAKAAQKFNTMFGVSAFRWAPLVKLSITYIAIRGLPLEASWGRLPGKECLAKRSLAGAASLERVLS